MLFGYRSEKLLMMLSEDGLYTHTHIEYAHSVCNLYYITLFYIKVLFLIYPDLGVLN